MNTTIEECFNSNSQKKKFEDKNKHITFVAGSFATYINSIKQSSEYAQVNEIDNGRCCKRASRLYKMFCIAKDKNYGNYVVRTFVLVKILYFINSFANLLILRCILGKEFLFFGIEALINKIGRGKGQSKQFPINKECGFVVSEAEIDQLHKVCCDNQTNLKKINLKITGCKKVPKSFFYFWRVNWY